MKVFKHKPPGKWVKMPRPCYKQATDYPWGKGRTHIIYWCDCKCSGCVEGKDINARGEFVTPCCKVPAVLDVA